MQSGCRKGRFGLVVRREGAMNGVFVLLRSSMVM
jgi:hypothetical protein